MRRELQEFLNHRPDLKFMIRENPEWYRTLSRNPFAIQMLEESSNYFYGKTFGQQIDRLNEQLHSVSAMMSLLSELNSK
jgi:hypothetical protein